MISFSVNSILESIKDFTFGKVLGARKIPEDTQYDETCYGKWEGAYVIIKEPITGYVTAGLFEDHMDYVGNPSWDEALTLLHDKLNNGWVIMHKEDISQTAGV